MGLKNFKTFARKAFTSIVVSSLKTYNTPFNIYIDGNILIFDTFTSTNIEKIVEYNNLDYCLNSFKSIIANIKATFASNITINNIFIYFDGQSPRNKRITQASRRTSTSFIKNKTIINLKNNIIKYCNSGAIPELMAIESNFGEGEAIIFHNRDITTPSILISKDTDLFPLCYKYTKNHENDIIFLYSNGVLYDCSNFKINWLPRSLFILLSILGGCDYFNACFTETMLNVLAPPPKNNELQKYRAAYLNAVGELDVNIDTLPRIVYCTLKLIYKHKELDKHRLVFPRQFTNNAPSKDSMQQTVGLICWTYNYITTMFLKDGQICLDKYNEVFQNYCIDPQIFLKWCILQIHPNDTISYEKKYKLSKYFKSIRPRINKKKVKEQVQFALQC